MSFSPRRDTNAAIGNSPESPGTSHCALVLPTGLHIFPTVISFALRLFFILLNFFLVVFRVAHISLTAPTSPVNKRRCGDGSRNE